MQLKLSFVLTEMEFDAGKTFKMQLKSYRLSKQNMKFGTVHETQPHNRTMWLDPSPLKWLVTTFKGTVNKQSKIMTIRDNYNAPFV